MTTLEAPDAPFRLSTPIEHITKLDDGTLIAHVVATSETPDGQGDPSGRGRWAGDIIDYDAMKAAAPGLMKWAILGEMHDPDRVDAGTILKLHFDDAARRVEADIHVVDPIAIRKVLARVYKMVSIGGIIQRYQLQEIAGRMYRRVTKMLVDELSLVPKGANPDAMISKQFILAKRDATMNADAGIASPLDLPAEEVASLATPPAEEGRTAAQVTIDEVRAALAKSDTPAPEQPASTKAARKEARKMAKAEADETATPLAKDADEAAAPEAVEKAAAPADEPADADDAKPGFPGAAAPFKGKKAAKKAAKIAKAAERETARKADAELVKAWIAAPTSADEPTTAAVARVVQDAPRISKRAAKLAKANARLRKAAAKLRSERRELRKASILTSVLTKSGSRNSAADLAKIDAIHAATVDLGASAHIAKAATPITPDSTDAVDTPQLAKGDTTPLDRGGMMRAALEEVGLAPGRIDELVSAVAAVSEKQIAQGEVLEKFARRPTGGGPATPYAPVFDVGTGRRGEGEFTSKGEALAKAAELVDEPRLKEQLGEAASLAMIQSARGR